MAEFEDDRGLVIVSLDVFSPTPIVELSPFERADEGEGSDGRGYDLGTIRVDEDEASQRADALESAVTTLLDLLSDVPHEVLFDDRMFVRLFITFGAGAQTLGSSLVQRLAAVNATLWLDT